MPTHFTLLDGLVLVGFFLITMGIGFYFRRRSGSVEGFTAAGRSLPGWLCGLSILATYVSSISFLALPGKAYAANWNPFVFSLSLPLAAWVGVKWFLPFYRRNSVISAYSHLEERFGPWARTYASACYLLIQLVRMGMITYLMALPMTVLLGWDIRSIIVLTTVLTTIYTLMGGITAVIWTDAFQTVILIGGALTCAVVMIVGLPEGPGQLWEIATTHDKFSLGSFSWDMTSATFWVVLIYGLVINLQNFGVDQNYIQRYHAAKSEREARKSLWIGGLLYLPVSAIFFFIGTALFAYYTARPEDLAPAYQAADKADFVFPYFIVTVLPPGVTGLLIAAIFSAAMSTISTSLNSSATVLLDDYYRRYVNRTANEQQGMRMLRVATVVWAGLALLIALLMSTFVKNALDASWLLAGIFSGGMLGLFLLGLLVAKAKSRGAAVGVIAGVVTIAWMTVSPHWDAWPDVLRSPFHHFLTIVFGTGAVLLTGAIAALFLDRGNRLGRPDPTASRSD